MSKTDMFVELAIKEEAPAGVVDNISRATPMLATMPTVKTNKGDENVYEIVTDIDAMPQTELDAPLQDVNAESRLEYEGMLHWSGKQEIGVGKLNRLGVSQGEYFASKAGKVFKKTAQNFESTMIYNKIQKFALDNNKANGIFKGNRAINFGGTTADKQFSIQIVTWDGDVTTGLYNPEGFGGRGLTTGMFNMTPIVNGAYLNTAQQLVYGMAYFMDAAIQLADPQMVTTIVNIENVDDLVGSLISGKLDYKLSLALENADPAAGQTYIYMRPELQVAVGAAFTNSMNETSFKIGEFESRLRTWQGVPIISTRNMYNGTEPVKTVA